MSPADLAAERLKLDGFVAKLDRALPVYNAGGTAWQSRVEPGGTRRLDCRNGSIAQDPNAIGFGGYQEGGPGLKTLALAAHDGGPYVHGTGETVSSSRYPLTRYLYIRVARAAGQPLHPQVREFCDKY